MSTAANQEVAQHRAQQPGGGSVVTHANPARLVEIAIEKGAEMDQLERLLALQERWEANEARKAFAAAMAAFRAEAPVISKNAEVDFSTQKGRTHYRHASLDHICERVNPVLGRHGLTYSWCTEQSQNTVTVHCDVMHVMGHTERKTLFGPRDESGNKNPIQSIGSAVTYLQRYTLLSALGLSTGGQDDDGTASGGEPVETITDDHAQAIRDKAGAAGVSISKLLDVVSRTIGYRVSAVSEIPAGTLKATLDYIAKQAPGRTEQQPYPEESFAANFKAWKGLIETGRKTPDQIIAMVSSKGTLTDYQINQVRACKPDPVEGEIVQ